MTDRLISLNAAIEAVEALFFEAADGLTHSQVIEALRALPDAWQPIETAPKDGDLYT